MFRLFEIFLCTLLIVEFDSLRLNYVRNPTSYQSYSQLRAIKTPEKIQTPVQIKNLNVKPQAKESYLIREVTSISELKMACKLCVDAFFGNKFQESFWHNLKLVQIFVELENLLKTRYNDPSKYLDAYIIALNADQNDNSDVKFWNDRINDFIGFVVLSMVSVDEACLSYLGYPAKSLTRSEIDGKYYIPKISNLSVKSDCRGKGIGFKLLDECCRKAKEWGYDQIILEVEYDNDSALNLYFKNGFQSLYSQNIKVYDLSRLFLSENEKKSIVMRKILVD